MAMSAAARDMEIVVKNMASAVKKVKDMEVREVVVVTGKNVAMVRTHMTIARQVALVAMEEGTKAGMERTDVMEGMSTVIVPLVARVATEEGKSVATAQTNTTTVLLEDTAAVEAVETTITTARVEATDKKAVKKASTQASNHLVPLTVVAVATVAHLTSFPAQPNTPSPTPETLVTLAYSAPR